MAKHKPFIVKVQISLESSDGKSHCLIYNKKRDVMWQGKAPKELVKLLNGEPKGFFYATLSEGDSGQIMLADPTKWQEW